MIMWNMAPITPVFSAQSVLPDEAGRRIVRCFGGDVACCARASRSRFGGGEIFFLFPFFQVSLDRSQRQPSPFTGEATASSRRTRTSKQENADLKQENTRSQSRTTVLNNTLRAFANADGPGSLDADGWDRSAPPSLDTKKTKGGTRIDSAVHAPQVRGLRQGRRRDGRVLHVRSCSSCWRCSWCLSCCCCSSCPLLLAR